MNKDTAAFTHRSLITGWGPGTIRVAFICDGPLGSVEFWFALMENANSRDNRSISIGGVERHSKQPLGDYESIDKPSHEDCQVLGGKCWHDGTSLYASETMIPGMFINGVEWVQQRLEETYRDWFVS